jgi:hypothetical protein
VLALLTTAAAVVLRCTWGTPVYGLTERVVLGLGMGWISALAGSALYQRRHAAGGTSASADVSAEVSVWVSGAERGAGAGTLPRSAVI